MSPASDQAATWNRVTCPQCRASVPAGVKFCGECGAALPNLCSACGAPLSSAARFCGECGATLAEAAAARRSAVQAAGAVTPSGSSGTRRKTQPPVEVATAKQPADISPAGVVPPVEPSTAGGKARRPKDNADFRTRRKQAAAMAADALPHDD